MNTWHTLKDNPGLWRRYFLRERVIRQIRLFFETRGFHEVETPILIGHPAAESYLDVFETTLLDRNRKPTKMYLSTSPEVALKKCMVAGIGNCFALTKSFRNTEVGDSLHNPEFTILEWYQVEATYTTIMEECEQLILHLLKTTLSERNRTDHHQQGLALNPQTLSYQDKHIDFSRPWKRLSVKTAFSNFAHIDFEEFLDLKKARAIAKSRGYVVAGSTTWEEIYNQIFLNEVEPHINMAKPVFLYDFPKAVGALAKTKKDDPRFVERFELYIAGLELADCYTELTDWKEQKMRFDDQLKEIKRLGKTPYVYDHDFISALKAGLPDCAGIAVGIDRLLMLLLNSTDIKDTMLFPAEECM